jgi:hypothetical protein
VGIRATFIGPTKGPTIPAEVERTALRLTVPTKLLRLTTLTTVEAVTPTGTSLCRPGTPTTLKSGGGTVTAIGIVWVREPDVPVTVTEYVPGGVLKVVETVRVTLPDAAGIVGALRLAESPATLVATAVTATLPEKPLSAIDEIDDVPEELSGTESVAGLAANRKSGGDTMTVTDWECVWPVAAVAVTITL